MTLCRTALWFTLSTLSLACAARVEVPRNAQTTRAAQKPRPEHIPVRRIRWFESGLTQIEREGQPTDGIVKFHVPRPQLDDILRTLAVHGENARVPQFSLDFESVVVPAVAQAEANLPAESAAGRTYVDLLLSLKGERVEVSDGEHAERGRLVDIVPWTPESTEDKASSTNDNQTKRNSKASAANPSAKGSVGSSSQYELTLLVDSGAIVRLVTRDSLRLRPLDERHLARLARALSSRSASAERYSPELRIKTDRDEAVTVSYVSEAPIPRLNYRLNLESTGGKLTGSVLLHNDSDETWQSVSVQICNDEPDASVLPLAAPRYNDRPVLVQASDLGNLLPQLHATSADTLSTSGMLRGVSLGSNTPKKPTSTQAHSVSTKWSPKPAAKRSSVRQSYQYNALLPVSLDAHASVLVPFFDATLKAERGVWLKSREHVGRSIVRLENTTSHLLPAGSMTIFESGRYAGTTQLTALEPQQTGFVDFGMESQLTVKWDQDPTPPSVSTIRSVSWEDGELWVHTTEHNGQTFEVSNTSDHDLSVYVSVSASDDAQITGADRIETLGLPRPAAAVIAVPAHKQLKRTLIIDQTDDTALDLDSPDLDEFKKLTESTILPETTRKILKAAYGECQAFHNMQTTIERNEEEISRIESAVDRLPSSNTNQGIAGRILQLESQRLGLQQMNSQLERAKQEKMDGLKRRLSQLKAPKEAK